jgi:hypothetical protein
MNDLFEVKTSEYNYYDLSDEEAVKKFVESFPEEVVSIVEKNKNGKENIYELSDQVLIREYAWSYEQPLVIEQRLLCTIMARLIPWIWDQNRSWHMQ